MAASTLIEEESGTYTALFRHPHNGYYAGDFFKTPRSGSELRGPHAERRGVRRAAAEHSSRPSWLPLTAL